LVERRNGDRRARHRRDDVDPRRCVGETRRQRCRHRRGSGGEHLAFDADVTGRPFERRVLGALDPGTDVIEHVPHAFLLQEQQED